MNRITKEGRGSSRESVIYVRYDWCCTDVAHHSVQAFCKQVITRGYLDHPNIHPFIGAMMVTEPGHEKYEVISEFMENGEIGEFIEKNRGMNRLELVCFESRPRPS